MKKRRILRIIATVCAVTLAVGIGVRVLTSTDEFSFDEVQRPFSASGWRASHPRGTTFNARFEMRKSVLARLNENQTAESVKQMLGEPDQILASGDIQEPLYRMLDVLSENSLRSIDKAYVYELGGVRMWSPVSPHLWTKNAQIYVAFTNTDRLVAAWDHNGDFNDHGW